MDSGPASSARLRNDWQVKGGWLWGGRSSALARAVRHVKRTAILNVVGLSESVLGVDTPRINEFLRRGAKVPIAPAFPAVTCTAQATYLTGRPPAQHGIVGNGWYDRELAEVQLWKQSERLVSGPLLWEALRGTDPRMTCAKLFWWYNMYSSADYTITPRPIYPADGRKIFDIYTRPYSIRPEIIRDLGEFPFPAFWGPAAGIDTSQGEAAAASRWIAAAARWIENKYQPTLSLVYLPHLDYNLQRFGPNSPLVARDRREIDSIVGDLIAWFRRQPVQVIVLSEYGLTEVQTPVHLNRLFRAQGWLAIKEELGLELLDAGASRVFAVADHQVAHIYVNEPALLHPVRELLERQAGVGEVWAADRKAREGLEHRRAGDLIAIASPDAWFTYFYWLDDARAPDFARTVDIHRKPGYDPVELFLDPRLPAVKLRIAWRLFQKRLGFRTLLDVVPLDARLVRGSHGRCPNQVADWPLLILGEPGQLPDAPLAATDIYGVLSRLIQA